MIAIASMLDTAMSTANPQDAHSHAGPEVCYRHPDRATGVTCQRCGRHVCGECSKQASVGVHCPECTKGTKQKVYTANTLPGANATVSRALIGINVALFVISIVFLGATTTSAGEVFRDFGTWGPPIAEDVEIWRIISGGFLHSGVLHIAFNMYLLWQLGRPLERSLGERDFIAVYMVSLLGGSFGAVLLSPLSPTVGASGAVFGLIGAMVFQLRSRNVGLFDTGLGFLIVINILFSFRGGVSLGGHLGGFLIGALLGALYFGLNAGEGPIIKDAKMRLVATIVIGVVLFAATFAAAMTWQNPLFG